MPPLERGFDDRSFPHRHLLGIEGLSASDILAILDAAEPWIAFNRGARKADDRLAGLTQINAFFENSARARSSRSRSPARGSARRSRTSIRRRRACARARA